MDERQIRIDIKAQLPNFIGDTVDARLVEEMEICAGRARADMALIADRLIGIEIKSPRDTLHRLPNQVDYYSKCFDQVVLVVHESHAKAAIQVIPRWWGVVIGMNGDGRNSYVMKRQPMTNRRVDVTAVLGLLWREEIETLFDDFCSRRAPSRASKRLLRETLVAEIPSSDLKAAGIRLLRLRKEWRSAPI